ncbi:MAG: Holliday junction branch migration protein RuvA [Dehalococcoidales bacterium]|nr:Holliday junction branch migration protein RuvA [Dehalococcoidales bacterium]
MIASLRGVLESVGSDWAIIDVHGIGFQVFIPASTLSSLGTRGKEVYLNTHLHIREDNVTLYGFATAADKELFQLLMSVSGIGPKLALSILSSISTEQLSLSIGTQNADLLTIVPGIGNKIANRMILELKDKIGSVLLAGPISKGAQDNTDVISALTALGYSVVEAARAAANLPSNKKLSLEDKVKFALQNFQQK